MERFIGAWRLISFEEGLTDGTIIHPYGENPIGLLVYDSSGQMSVQIMRRDRERLSADVWQQATAEETRTALEGYTGFFGSFEVDDKAGIVIHRVEGHVIPDSVGKTLTRTFSFEGDLLILRPAPNRTLIWSRIAKD